MEIRKFDLQNDNIDMVAELIWIAHTDEDKAGTYDEKFTAIARDLIEAGNNFLGHENIYLCHSDGSLVGLFIGYTGKSYSKAKTVINLLIQFKLTQILNYLIISAQLFDTLYTPKLDEDDFYVSVIVVDREYRNQGIGAFMLSEIAGIARGFGCKRIALDVNKENTTAQSLYRKFGFIKNTDHQGSAIENLDNTYYSMEYILS